MMCVAAFVGVVARRSSTGVMTDQKWLMLLWDS